VCLMRRSGRKSSEVQGRRLGKQQILKKSGNMLLISCSIVKASAYFYDLNSST
jgi:hypothetical protein